MNIRDLVYRFRGEVTTEELVRRGLKIGKNFKRLNHVIIDDSHTWLIEIGDDVTLSPRVHILAHDASTKTWLGYTKIGNVKIGNRVFIGADTIVLPNVAIGNDVIIGAHSVVTHDIPDGMMVVGNPARIVCSTLEYLNKERVRMEKVPVYGIDFTMRGKITLEKKKIQKAEVSIHGGGFVK